MTQEEYSETTEGVLGFPAQMRAATQHRDCERFTRAPSSHHTSHVPRQAVSQERTNIDQQPEGSIYFSFIFLFSFKKKYGQSSHPQEALSEGASSHAVRGMIKQWNEF